MKTLFIARHYESSPSWYCERALKKIGVEFEAFDFVDEAGGYDFLHVPSKNPLISAARKILWRKNVNAMNKKLARSIQNSGADFVVFLGTGTDIIFPHTLRVFSSCKAVKFLWIIDAILPGQSVPPIVAQCLSAFDACLIVDAHYETFFKQKGAKHARVLDLGCDPEIHKPISLTEEEKQRYGSPVVYIGNYFAQGEQRLSLLRALCGKFQVRIWGRGWDTAGESVFKKAWTGKPAYREEMCKVYSASKICLNMLPKEAVNFLNVRIFEAAACGTLVLTEHRERLAQAYNIGEEIESWKTQEELVNKMDYFLSHEGERVKIAKAGQERTLSHHTYESQMKTLCRWVQEMRS